MSRRSISIPDSARPEHIVETDNVNGFQKGDTVRITGERGRYRFQAYEQNIETGTDWVVLYGGVFSSAGKPIDTKFRYVTPDRIRKVKTPR